MKKCALLDCDKPVTNWRISCCCMTHQRIYAGKKRHNLENTPIKDINQRKAEWSAYVVLRQRKKNQSFPEWANHSKIQLFYDEARRLTKETGILHEVDHIIPSNHKLVCGLHNEFNLQVLPWYENRTKSNKFNPESF